MENAQWEVVSQSPKSSSVWVMVVPRVVARQQLRGSIRISQHMVEVKHRVEDATVSDERIGSRTGLLAFDIRVRLCVIGGRRCTKME